MPKPSISLPPNVSISRTGDVTVKSTAGAVRLKVGRVERLAENRWRAIASNGAVITVNDSDVFSGMREAAQHILADAGFGD